MALYTKNNVHTFTSTAFLTALHWMQSGLVRRKLSVCPSVRLSVKRLDCDKTEESYIQIFIPYGKSCSL